MASLYLPTKTAAEKAHDFAERVAHMHECKVTVTVEFNRDVHHTSICDGRPQWIKDLPSVSTRWQRFVAWWNDKDIL